MKRKTDFLTEIVALSKLRCSMKRWLSHTWRSGGQINDVNGHENGPWWASIFWNLI